MSILNRLNNNVISNALRNTNDFLNPAQKKKSYFIFLLLIINSAFDVLGLSGIIPIVYIASDIKLIHSNEYLSSLYNYMGFTNEMHFLLFISFLLIIIFLLKNILSIFIQYIQTKYAFDISLTLCKKQFQYYYKKGHLFINKQDSGTFIYTISAAPTQFAIYYLMPILFLFTEFFVILLIISGLFIYNPYLVILLISILVPSFGFIYLTVKNNVKKLGIKRDKIYPKSISLIMESMKGYIDIKLNNKEEEFSSLYFESQNKINNIDLINSSIYDKIHQRANEIILALAIFTVFLYTILFPVHAEETILILGIMATAALRLLPSINKIITNLMIIKRFSVIPDRLHHIKNKQFEKFQTEQKLEFKDKIELTNLSFSYEEGQTDVLKNINLTINKGEMIGIVGKSGSGKSTLLNIILRLIKETSGQMSIDGKAINHDNEIPYQLNVAYVQQNTFIRNSSLLSNITMRVDEEYDKDKMKTSIKTAALDDLDLELDHIIIEGGTNLSGGQRQRIGIARSIYKEADIIIFDEPTSALDPVTEGKIIETIQNLKELGKTIIFVTHKSKTLKYCDKIYSIKEGKLLDSSTNHSIL